MLGWRLISPENQDATVNKTFFICILIATCRILTNNKQEGRDQCSNQSDIQPLLSLQSKQT